MSAFKSLDEHIPRPSALFALRQQVATGPLESTSSRCLVERAPPPPNGTHAAGHGLTKMVQTHGSHRLHPVPCSSKVAQGMAADVTRRLCQSGREEDGTATSSPTGLPKASDHGPIWHPLMGELKFRRQVVFS